MKTMPPKKEPPLNFDGVGVTGVVVVVVVGSVVVVLGVVGVGPGVGWGVVSGVAVVVSFAGAAVVTVSSDGDAKKCSSFVCCGDKFTSWIS